MRWKTKAKIQKFVSLLPSSLSYATYYWLQRHFGNLKTLNPVRKLSAAIAICQKISEHAQKIEDKVFFEVGTGRVPIVPIGFWLMGAKKTITIDLNPYMKSELVAESLNYISDHADYVLELFGDLINKKRFQKLLELKNSSHFSLPSVLDLCSIEYIAPGNAENTGLCEEAIDFHTSYAVFEHIPPNILKTILREGSRITKGTGLFVHMIDYTDHFIKSDRTISSINFLQYSDSDWGKIADNRYMYMNRLRHDDFIEIFESAGQCIIKDYPTKDPGLLDLLNNGTLKLDRRFNSKSKDIITITDAWFISKKK
ncbi:hypothetical protein JCM14469_43110 [Desulfatiferula olefinivorans]